MPEVSKDPDSYEEDLASKGGLPPRGDTISPNTVETGLCHQSPLVFECNPAAPKTTGQTPSKMVTDPDAGPALEKSAR
jgi:hypothetical protein